ncbi:hypothetical protein QI633_04075 [Nocardioides sp. QY071]|uniref:Vgb family protein n=1 Tax=Nocardioides sp. QY071 TaxID=3044187 RepID=UPI00249C5831|nr:hypothetical protein [Nocardioides sp. QY071]WGY02935.1 hypothetical protein QI633_04075 [Nocardioides sp. QY071]
MGIRTPARTVAIRWWATLAVTTVVLSSAGLAPAGARANDGAAAVPASGPTIATYPVPTADARLDSLVRGPDGNLWFAESKGWKLGRITASGSITEFGVVPDGGSTGPTELVSGDDGYLYFLTDTSTRLRRATTGGVVEPMAGYNNAQGGYLTAGRGRGVWSSKLGPSDAVLRVWVDPSTNATTGWQLPTSYGTPTPMAVAADGALWYGDARDHLRRVDDIHPDLGGTERSYPAQWVNPNYDTTSLAFGADGALWATGYSPGQVFTTAEGGAIGRFDGTRLVSWMLPPLAAGTEPVPLSLVLGPDGALWWAEREGVGRIAPDGTMSRARIAPWAPREIAFGPDGRLWFIDTGANRVGAITIDEHLFPPRQVPRTVKLRKAAGGWAKGRVVAEAGCRAGKVVAYAKARKGKPRRIGAGKANARGKFAVRLRKRTAGKVFVKVKASSPSAGLRCLAARSRAR